MPATRVFTPENRLAKAIGGPGAPSMRELVIDAQIRVNALKEPIRQYVAGRVRDMTQHVAAADDVLLAEIVPISWAAMNVAEVAGAADLEMLGEVAMGIVAMADSWTSTGLWHADALRVHLASLTLVPEATDDQGRQIVQQLQTLRRSIGAQE